MLTSIALLAPSDAFGVAGGQLTLVDARGRPLGAPYQGWVDRSLVPTVGGRLKVFLGGCPWRPRSLGCVNTRRLHSVYVRRGAPNLRSVLFHELGHLFDLRVLGASERRTFKRLYGHRQSGWYGGAQPPAERFAEAYSLCARKRRLRRVVRGSYGFAAAPRRHARTCQLIRRAAGPAEPPKRPPQPPIVTTPVPAASAPPPAQERSLFDLLFSSR